MVPDGHVRASADRRSARPENVSDGKTTELRSRVWPVCQRRPKVADALAAYHSGTNTRVQRALGALFRGSMSKKMVSRVWPKVESDWKVWDCVGRAKRLHRVYSDNAPIFATSERMEKQRRRSCANGVHGIARRTRRTHGRRSVAILQLARTFDICRDIPPRVSSCQRNITISSGRESGTRGREGEITHERTLLLPPASDSRDGCLAAIRVICSRAARTIVCLRCAS